MSTEVRVRYEFTMKEMQHASLIWRRENAFAGRAWYGTIFGKVMVLAYLVMVMATIWQSWLSRSIEGFLIYLVLAPLVLWKLSRSWASRIADWNHRVQYTISCDRWLIETHTLRDEFRWPPVKSVVRVREGFVVDFHDRSFRWLPIHGFESEAAIESFVGMVKSHDVKYEDRQRRLAPCRSQGWLHSGQIQEVDAIPKPHYQRPIMSVMFN